MSIHSDHTVHASLAIRRDSADKNADWWAGGASSAIKSACIKCSWSKFCKAEIEQQAAYLKRSHSACIFCSCLEFCWCTLIRRQHSRSDGAVQARHFKKKSTHMHAYVPARMHTESLSSSAMHIASHLGIMLPVQARAPIQRRDAANSETHSPIWASPVQSCYECMDPPSGFCSPTSRGNGCCLPREETCKTPAGTWECSCLSARICQCALQLQSSDHQSGMCTQGWCVLIPYYDQFSMCQNRDHSVTRSHSAYITRTQC